MRVMRGRPNLSLVAAVVVAVLLLLCYQGAVLLATYGSLFYIETFLPSPPLPHQRRTPDSLTPGGVAHRAVARPPRVLCLVVTSPRHHQGRARHVKETWLKHCDQSVFLSSEADTVLGDVVVVPQAPDYHQLWDKVIAGFEWAVGRVDQFDWMVKTDDDTFMMVENLKNLLQHHSPDKLLATGLFLSSWNTGATYLNGGAGYAVSRAVVQEVASAVQVGGRCTQQGGMKVTTEEDLNMAECFRKIGVSLIDSRDQHGRQRFHVYPPQSVIDPRKATDWGHLWLKKIPVYPYKFGYKDLSSEVISFHYVNAETMYLLYYLVYIVNPHQTVGSEVTRIGNSVLPMKPASGRTSPAVQGKARTQSGQRVVSQKSRRSVVGLTKETNLNSTDTRKNFRRNTKAAFGIARNKKYNYFYKSGSDDDNDKMKPESTFKRPHIEKIGISNKKKSKWNINNNNINNNNNNNNKDRNTDHSVL